MSSLENLKLITYNSELDYSSLLHSRYQNKDIIKVSCAAKKWLRNTNVTPRSKLVARNVSVLDKLTTRYPF